MPEPVARRDRATGLAVGRPAVCTIVAMVYDQEFAGRIRQLIGSDPELTEKKMFGGLAFLIRGNMAIAASSQGGAMVRVDPRQSAALIAATAATVMEMRGRPMPLQSARAATAMALHHRRPISLRRSCRSLSAMPPPPIR